MRDIKTTTSYHVLLTQAAGALTADDDPDGLLTRWALLLAAHAGTNHAGGTGDADWDLYNIAISQAVRALQAELSNPMTLATGVPEPGPDSSELRYAVASLVGWLADMYATAASGETGSPSRRLVWAQVAHHLNDAAAELT